MVFVESMERVIRRRGWFLRRRDLLVLGYTDAGLRAALGERRIFRVRQGWYSVPGAPDDAVRAVRVGGRLTGIAALASYGLRVPRRAVLDVAVPVNACRLRNPADRRRRLAADATIAVHWVDEQRVWQASTWRVSLADALLHIVGTEQRDIAVACLSAVMRYKRWSSARIRAVVLRGPARAHGWAELASALDDSHGETFVRLWLGDAGVPYESQPVVLGLGRLDGSVSPNVFIEVDGGQHDPEWTGDGASTWEHDHDRDVVVVADGGQVLRYTYRQLYTAWPQCLAAIERARADDLELVARRVRHPAPRAFQA